MSITLPFGFLGTAAAGFENTYSCDFDGVDDYVDCGDITQLNSVSAFTISLWVKLVNTSGGDYIISKYDSGSNRIHIIVFGNTIYFQQANGGSAYGTASFTSTSWTHIAMVYDGSGTGNAGRLQGYVNGSALTLSYTGTVAATTANLSGKSFIIGQQNSGFYTEGNVDEVAIFSSSLSGSAINDIYNSGTPTDLAYLNPVAWYRMGDGDTFPYLNNESAFSNRSVDFDGVDDYVDAPVDELNSVTAMSISCWVKKATTGATFRLGDYVSNDYGFWFYWDASTIYWAAKNGTGADYATVSPTATTNWVHWVGTYSASSNKILLYQDGSLVATRTGAPSSLSSVAGDAFKIGMLTGLSGSMSGNIDDVAIFNSELSASDVTTIYNSGTPNDISGLSPISWWKMGDGDTYPTLTDNGSGGNNGTMTNMAAEDIVGAETTGTMTNMVSGDIVADVP